MRKVIPFLVFAVGLVAVVGLLVTNYPAKLMMQHYGIGAGIVDPIGIIWVAAATFGIGALVAFQALFPNVGRTDPMNND